MILIDGVVSVQTPIHPQTMLARVRDLINNTEHNPKNDNDSAECIVEELDNGYTRDVCK